MSDSRHMTWADTAPTAYEIYWVINRAENQPEIQIWRFDDNGWRIVGDSNVPTTQPDWEFWSEPLLPPPIES